LCDGLILTPARLTLELSIQGDPKLGRPCFFVRVKSGFGVARSRLDGVGTLRWRCSGCSKHKLVALVDEGLCTVRALYWLAAHRELRFGGGPSYERLSCISDFTVGEFLFAIGTEQRPARNFHPPSLSQHHPAVCSKAHILFSVVHFPAISGGLTLTLKPFSMVDSVAPECCCTL
jgi:hypothetical protein